MPELLAFFQKAFYFMILISIVVIVHEWGHFIVARLCGVGVEAFSLFFGKPLLKWKRGRTEWRLSAIPLGGYVKMIGQVDLQPDAKDQVPEELRPLSFAHKPLWARSAIVAAGPLMNVVLTFVIFSAIFFVGYPQTTSLIGHVDRGGVADEAGLRAGDRVVSVDGKEIWRWDELSETVRKNPERRLVLTVERGDERLQLPVTPRLGRQKNIFQFEVDAGLIGISPDGFLPIIGVTGPGTPAAAAGFKTGDLISGIDGEPVRDFADFERKLARADGHTIIMVERGGLSRRAEERNPETFEATIALTDERPTPESLRIRARRSLRFGDGAG
ncbi:MAG: RIP metalloprotease RseP [Deltaproteobacteria bacterium]|nr:RIP metalloprotease RseP [Deltaproteobacteria bacterium]